MEKRICCDCGEERAIDQFRLRTDTGGRRPFCLDCDLARKRAHYAANREAHDARGKRWRDRNLDRARAYQRRYQAENAEKVQAWKDAYNQRQRKPEAVQLGEERAALLVEGKKRCSRCGLVKSVADFGRRGFPKRHLYQSQCRSCIADVARPRRDYLRYRARKREAFVERVIPGVVFERDAGICGICGEMVDPARFHIDHIVPLVRGGEHSYANVQVAHPHCNHVKSDKLLVEMRVA